MNLKCDVLVLKSLLFRMQVVPLYRQDLDYVSCSPFRVPIARLAAAQAALKNA
jgi:hypothetical protein